MKILNIAALVAISINVLVATMNYNIHSACGWLAAMVLLVVISNYEKKIKSLIQQLTTMTKQFKPIAMRCTQEQFQTVKDEIVKRGGKIVNVYNSSWDSRPYLTNNFNGIQFQFGNISDEMMSDYNRTVYETFDRNIFLEACGWGRKIIGYKRNPKMDVTAEQLAYLLNCSFTEKGGLFFWLDSDLGFIAQVEYITRAQSLNIIGEDKMLVPVYEEEEEPITDKTYTLEQYNTFNEMQKLALNEFVLVHKSKVAP